MRHIDVNIIGPDVCGEVTKEGMISAMEDASKLVASRPQWKREVLRGPDPAQPSMKEAMARVDARAEKVVAGIPLGQRAIISKDELQPAQPSVGERLGRIAENVYFNTSMEGETLWDEVALAVRREVLAEGFTEEDIDAVSRLPEVQMNQMFVRRILSAALASRVKRAESEGMMSGNHYYGANQMTREQLEQAFIRERMVNEQSLQASRVWFEHEKKDRETIAALRAQVEKLKEEAISLRAGLRVQIDLDSTTKAANDALGKEITQLRAEVERLKAILEANSINPNQMVAPMCDHADLGNKDRCPKCGAYFP